MFSFFKSKRRNKTLQEKHSEIDQDSNDKITNKIDKTIAKIPSSQKNVSENNSFIIYEDEHFKLYLHANRTYLEIDKKMYSVGCKHPYDPISYISDNHGMTKFFRPGWYFNKNEMSYLLENGTIRSITGRDLSAYDMCHLLETIVNSESDDLDIGEMERKTFN